MDTIKLLARILIQCDIEVLTGLYIGGKGGNLEIGGIDNTVIRNALTQEPFIPGSSMRGKMRSQLEKKLGSRQNQSIGNAITIHVCKGLDAQKPCPVCRLFGMPATENIEAPTRLLVRDVNLTPDTVEKLNKAHTDQLFTETKAEVAIDRVTAKASPRTLERVPAGAVFGPAEFVFSLYHPQDAELLADLQDCLQLTEDDYLGGGGSRGNGKIRFSSLRVTLRIPQQYSQEVALGTFAGLPELRQNFPSLQKAIQGALEPEKG